MSFPICNNNNVRTNHNLNLYSIIFFLLCLPVICLSQSDCTKDDVSPFCMVKSVAIKGIDSLGGVDVKFPRIAYDKCSEVKVIDYYLVAEELKIESGHFLACGTHELQTFVMDSKGNYSICEFTVSVNCNGSTIKPGGNN